MITLRHGAALVFLATVASGCDENLASVAGPTPNLTPTFSSIQRDILQATDSSGRPACASCHNPNGGAFRAVGLDMSSGATYASLVGVSSRQKPGLQLVAPGDPENSYLIHKLEGRTDIVGVRMPQRGPYLEDGQISIVKRWIQLGAQRD